jgi:hypothetical protein
MSPIPLHLQRRFEQRWAARFVPADAAAPKSIVPKATVNRMPPKATRVPVGDRRNRFSVPTKQS